MTGPVTGPAEPPPAGPTPEPGPVTGPPGRPAAVGVPARAGPAAPGEPGDAEARKFDEEIRSAIRYEKGLAVKAVIALSIVALVILVRVMFLG